MVLPAAAGMWYSLSLFYDSRELGPAYATIATAHCAGQRAGRARRSLPPSAQRPGRAPWVAGKRQLLKRLAVLASHPGSLGNASARRRCWQISVLRCSGCFCWRGRLPSCWASSSAAECVCCAAVAVPAGGGACGPAGLPHLLAPGA